ncbi:hypothetical protein L486_05610 [Kwoniella mangroviensis CBS 10435]|uniref:Uncharacterized protein n=1 Tax=Kwoniella mangroviensis CBS 10435 TaxID=1331196 RepID=A0A1B9IME0_9TREE|nr:uncharacterized protein I203_07258 [Kwoniella mangroviensis CBS 8507]OCF56755.1 hypothetical protein L486_05610 [Kwoniella mangroviensis CBS 10435]OCF63560.1 hypothetical protein I203_07258 [Kwoniella mangroviensis CBS 8507]OCF75327.1 hypothetical protein I204_04182 [Kwoniella mangroviensis CBS 8886]
MKVNLTEYDQIRELYTRVMTDTQSEHLHSDTAKLLKFADTIVQHKYLVQQCAISPRYAQAIYDILPADQQAKLDIEKIGQDASTAHLVGKDVFRMPRKLMYPTTKIIGVCRTSLARVQGLIK